MYLLWIHIITYKFILCLHLPYEKLIVTFIINFSHDFLGLISKFLLIWLNSMLVTGYNYDRIIFIIWDKPWYVILIKASPLGVPCGVSIVYWLGGKLILILCFLWTQDWLWWLSREEELGVGIWGIVSLTSLRCGWQHADSGGLG